MKHFTLGILYVLALFGIGLAIGFMIGHIEGEDGSIVTITHEAGVLMAINPQAAAASGAAGAAR